MWRSIIIALALTCLALLGWYAVRKMPGQVEDKLEARVQQAVTAKAPGLIVQASQRDIVLMGRVRDPAAQKEMRELVAALSGVKAVHDKTSVGVAPVDVAPPPAPRPAPTDMKPPPSPPPERGPHDSAASDAQAGGQPTAEADAAPAAADVAVAAATDIAAPKADAGPAAPAAPSGPLTAAQCEEVIASMIEGEKRITFLPNTGRLTPEGEAKVTEVYAVLQRCPEAKGVIEGYHDDLGDPDKLRTLTRKRAFGVYKKLVELGMDKQRFTYAGLSYQNMRYRGKPEMRVLNQRVEFNITVE